MLVHFLVDEKVTDQVIENFDRVTENIFLIFSANTELKYVRSFKENVIVFNKDNDDINKNLERLSPIGIILHSMSPDFAEAVLKINKNIPIGWYPWGYDIYFLPKIKPHIYGDQTKQFLQKCNKFLRYGNIIRQNTLLSIIYNYIKFRELDPYYTVLKATKRIKYFLSYIQEDYSYYSNFYPNKLLYINSTFSTINQYLAGNKELIIDNSAGNIVIGNSNSPESNHLDVFEILYKNTNVLENVNIYVPLSYGVGTDSYINHIISTGKKLFFDRFVPMLDFMDRTEYLNVLKSCSVGIFYHYRQQAMGNIIAMLYMGCRVYLSTNNPVFHYLKRIGIKAFDLEKEFDLYKNSRLSEEDVECNRVVLERLFSKEKVLHDLTEVVNLFKH